MFIQLHPCQSHPSLGKLCTACTADSPKLFACTVLLPLPYCPCQGPGETGRKTCRPVAQFIGAGDRGTGKVLQVGVDLADPCDSPFDQLPPSQRVEMEA